MNLFDLQNAVSNKLLIKHYLFLDVLFLPIKVLDITDDYVQLTGNWINVFTSKVIDKDCIDIKLEHLENWKLYDINGDNYK